MTTLLLVEDDPAIYDAIAPYVKREGWELRRARSVAEARSVIDELLPDVALVDRGLPGGAGDVLAPSLRERNIPFLMLTARARENERLAGFDLGADDYVTKPFSAAELMRRVSLLLRGHGAPRLKLGADVELDCEAQRVRAGGREVDLTATEFALLERLARQSGRVFTRAELATLVDLDLESSERTIDSHVKNIRKKLREAERAQRAERELVAGVAHDLAMWLVFKVAVRPGNRVRAP